MSRILPSLLLPAALAVPALLCGCASGGVPAGGSSGSQSSPSRGVSSAPDTAVAAPSSAAAAGTGRTGCDLVARSEASAAAGVSLGAGHQAPYTPQKDIIAHSGCQFSSGATAIGYDLNTITSSIPVSAALASGLAKAKAAGGARLSVNGNPGFSMARGPLQMVTFYKGHTSVGVLASNTKPGAALAIAKLIAARM